MKFVFPAASTPCVCSSTRHEESRKGGRGKTNRTEVYSTVVVLVLVHMPHDVNPYVPESYRFENDSDRILDRKPRCEPDKKEIC